MNIHTLEAEMFFPIALHIHTIYILTTTQGKSLNRLQNMARLQKKNLGENSRDVVTNHHNFPKSPTNIYACPVILVKEKS